MKANELRIGNWYRWYAERRYYEYQVEETDFCYGNMVNFEPIPLTEEWLVRLGFKKLTQGGSIYKVKDFHVQDFSQLGIYECNNHIEIKYVHQLQNLYFALTGQELELE